MVFTLPAFETPAAGWDASQGLYFRELADSAAVDRHTRQCQEALMAGQLHVLCGTLPVITPFPPDPNWKKPYTVLD